IAEPLAEGEVALVGGRGTYRFTPPDWGDYVVTAEDPEGGMRSVVDVHTWGGDHAPSPERERVRVRLDRERYAPGDTVRARIETPFDGTALVCLERNRVFAWKSVPVKGRAAEVEFRLPDGCAPNLYCTATVVRAVASSEAWRPHRVCGVETVVIDTDPHLVDVEVEADLEARPGQATEVVFRVTLGGKPLPGAVVTVAAVDEGILQLTRFRTPDPFAAYWGKEALQVGSRDLFPLLFPELAGAARSEPGGGEGGPMIPRTSPVRAERFVSAALWFPRLRTDDEGRAVVSAVLPAYIGELRWMAVAARDDAFGWVERPMTVTKPLLMEVSAPRFAATGDRFEATVTVRNRSEAQETVHLSCSASGGVECLEGNSRSDVLAAGDERTWRFPLRCSAADGAARLDFRARMGAEVAEESFPLPIRPPCERVTSSRTGRVDRGAVQAIDVPVTWIEGTGRTRLVLSAKPGIRFAGDLTRLLVYPYGCVEQTTSKAFPLLYVDDLLRVARPLDAEETHAGDLVSAAMERLESMRTRSGGLSMWPGGTETYDWGTAYAGHFLVEAKRAGHETPTALLDGVLRHLGVVLSERATDAHDLDVQAYAAFVLSTARAVRIGDLTPLRDRAEELSPTARGHLAAALAAHGRTREAAALLADANIPEGERRDTGGALHSSVRDAALLLSVLIDTVPDHPKVGELAERLDAASAAGRWSTTQETAFALVALGKYAAQARGASTTLTGEVRIGDDPPRPFRDQEEVIVEWPQDAHGGVEVRVEGTGVAFWRWESDGVPEAGAAPEVDRGLRVRRAFLGTDGKPLEARRIAQGEVVVVELTVESDAAYMNSVVKDLLPAGFEVENPRLADYGVPGGSWMMPDYAEYLDDRVSIVFEACQKRIFRYAMRAVTPGTFVMAPSEASCMYDPRPLSRWGRVEWEVTPR
ncbi:MAG: alpha-2-macroglobulin family protein, partial [Planctomycetota bacterium]